MITVWDTFPHLDITIHQPQTAANSKAAKDYPAGHNAPITAMPIKTIFSPHGGMGTVSAIFTRDCKYILSIGSDSPQTLCIWDWTTESDSPIIQTELKGSAQVKKIKWNHMGGWFSGCNLILFLSTFKTWSSTNTHSQDSIRINPEDPTEFLTTGVKSVNFFLWDKETGIKQFTPNFEPRYDEYSCGRADSIRVSPLWVNPENYENWFVFFLDNTTRFTRDFKHEHTGFTCTTFIPSSSQAVSGTKEGAVVIWSDRTLNNLSVKLEKGLKAAVKVLK